MLRIRKRATPSARTLELSQAGNRRSSLTARARRRGHHVRCQPRALGAAGRARSQALQGPRAGRVLGSTSFPPIGDLPYLLTLPAHGFYWFRLAPMPRPPPAYADDRPDETRSGPVRRMAQLLQRKAVPWRMGMADPARQLESRCCRAIEGQRGMRPRASASTRRAFRITRSGRWGKRGAAGSAGCCRSWRCARRSTFSPGAGMGRR